MQKYLDIQQGAELESTTCFTENEDGEKVIQTSLSETVVTTIDPGELNLPVGRAQRGSFKVICLGNGRYALRTRRFQHTTASTPSAEPIYTSTHGKMYQNSRKTRVVFEFSRDASFSNISDALDDEVYELRSFLDKEGKC